MANKSVHVSVGDLRSRSVMLSFSCMAGETGEGTVFISSRDFDDRRKAVHSFLLDAEAYKELKRLIADTDTAIEQLKRDGHLKPDQFPPDPVLSGKRARVVLMSVSKKNRLSVIRLVTKYGRLSLSEGVRLVDAAPCTLFNSIPVEESSELQTSLQAAGAVFAIEPVVDEA